MNTAVWLTTNLLCLSVPGPLDVHLCRPAPCRLIPRSLSTRSRHRRACPAPNEAARCARPAASRRRSAEPGAMLATALSKCHRTIPHASSRHSLLTRLAASVPSCVANARMSFWQLASSRWSASAVSADTPSAQRVPSPAGAHSASTTRCPCGGSFQFLPVRAAVVAHLSCRSQSSWAEAFRFCLVPARSRRNVRCDMLVQSLTARQQSNVVLAGVPRRDTTL